MLLFVSLASAEGLPWECPAVDIPEDATVYRDTDAGLGEVWDSLADAAEVYTGSDACTWVGTTTVADDAYRTTVTEDVCEATGFGVTRTTTEREDTSDPYGTLTLTTTVLLVTVDTGEWTRLLLTDAEETWWSSSIASEQRTLSAEWVGSLDGVLDDSWFSVLRSTYSSRGSLDEEARSVDTPDCAFSWSRQESDSIYVTESVRTPDHHVSTTTRDPACTTSAAGSMDATFDGASYGPVYEDTWADYAVDPDADGDGYAPPEDCDDTDPGRNPCEPEIMYDGIDQDCDGADLVDYDLDNDGVDGTDFGGGDCDDTDRTVYAGADDIPGDGIDQDCDGADDVDADGDGYTADGDDDLADCDDTAPRTAPGWYDVPYDGVDQDCSGADTTDVDGDGFDGDAVGGPDCDDRAWATYPGADDPTCDGVDQDCGGDPGECDTGDTGDTGETGDSGTEGDTDDTGDTGDTADTDTTEDTDSGEEPPLGCGAGAGAWLLMVPLLRARRQLGHR